ncbi:MAG: phosphatidate cytidylyltransferase, partial [Tepidisphaeraceae bacterium]
MEQTLRNRLFFGTLMLLALFVLLWVDQAVQRYTLLLGWNRTDHGPAGFGGVGLIILLVVILPVATRELAALFTVENVQPYRTVVFFGSCALLIHAFATQFPRFRPIAASTLAFIIVSVMLIAAFQRAATRQTQEAITRMAGTVLSTLYLGGLAWFLIALRVKRSWSEGEPRFIGSTMVVLMILLVVKFTDIGAYFGGRAFGKHKLIAWLSPKKTWEGLACGLLTAGLVGAACAPRVSQLSWQRAFVFGVVIGGVGQL